MYSCVLYGFGSVFSDWFPVHSEWFQTHFEWVSLVSGRIPMHFQLTFTGIWEGFRLVLEGTSIGFGWIPMLFGSSAMHFGWISNACSMDIQLCCLAVGMLSSLRGIKKKLRTRRDCPPIGNGLAVGALSSRRDVGLSNAFWMGLPCFWKDFNAFWIDV